MIERMIDGQLVKDGTLDKKSLMGFLLNKRERKKHAEWFWTLLVLEVWYEQIKMFISASGAQTGSFEINRGSAVAHGVRQFPS